MPSHIHSDGRGAHFETLPRAHTKPVEVTDIHTEGQRGQAPQHAADEVIDIR